MKLSHVYRWLRRHLLQRLMPSSKKCFPTQITHVEVVGYFSLIAGVGESARLCAWALSDDGFTISCTDVTSSTKKTAELILPEQETLISNNRRGVDNGEGVRILHLNPPMLPPAIFHVGFRRYTSSFNIAYWAWELENVPQEWIMALRYVNAVFVPSSFTAGALSKHTAKPVIVVPHPVKTGAATKGVRSRLSLPSNSFLVTTVFSFGSSVERKFPEASVEAFRQAFPLPIGAYLVIKTTHGQSYKPDLARLNSFISNSPNIILIDGIWSSEEISGLISQSNVYISLHRSEGFGLTIAEAIMRSVPVIATNWSGNIDFCCPRSTSLVGHKLVTVASNDTVAAFHSGYWADPDVAEAALALRRILGDQDEARKKADDAKIFAEAYFANHTYRDGLTKLRALTAKGCRTARP